MVDFWCKWFTPRCFVKRFLCIKVIASYLGPKTMLTWINQNITKFMSILFSHRKVTYDILTTGGTTWFIILEKKKTEIVVLKRLNHIDQLLWCLFSYNFGTIHEKKNSSISTDLSIIYSVRNIIQLQYYDICCQHKQVVGLAIKRISFQTKIIKLNILN